MESHVFDAVTRRVAAISGRRDVIRAIVGAMALGGLAADRAAAQAACRQPGATCSRSAQCCTGICPTSLATPRSLRNRCGCPAGEVLCGRACIVPGASLTHCKGCNRGCPATADTCSDGECSCGGGEICPRGSVCSDGCCRSPFRSGSCTAATFRSPYTACLRTVDEGDILGLGINTSQYEGDSIELSDYACASSADCQSVFAYCDQPGVQCACAVGFAVPGEGTPYTTTVTAYGQQICMSIRDSICRVS